VAWVLALASVAWASCGSGQRSGGSHGPCVSDRVRASCRTNAWPEGGRLV
jgi:hypothetical protein